MTRKLEAGNSMPLKKVEAAMRSLRTQIDRLDVQILKLINERASHAAEIGHLKNDHGAEVFTPDREEEVLVHVVEVNKGPLPTDTVRSIFREIISGSRALQKRLKIAYLGPEYSFSHLAAVERFGHSVEFVKVASIAAVFEEVSRGHVEFGVVPLENSTNGSISDTLDMFVRIPQIIICAEVRLRIHHNLLSNVEQQKINRVYSHPQALSQCRTWLSKNLPHALLREVSSTAVAADLAQKELGAAAVASKQAAVTYGLRVLFENIEDSPYNETRFAVIGYQKSPRTGKDKTAAMFRIPHSPGSLVEALDIFRQSKINLTWIEAFPARTAGNEYIFFVDFDGHAEDAKVAKALRALQDQCEEVTVLGSYPAAEVSG
jgi:chorismate mutase/prephenate dehydratase